MELKKVHIKLQEVVGRLRGREVYHILTHGGLSLIAAHKGGQIVTLGAGPVLALSKFLAERKEPDIKWSEVMAKSDSAQNATCPLCRQPDTADQCLCLYRDGYAIGSLPRE